MCLNDGKIAETGTHDELLAKKGIYYKLVMAQRQTTKMAETEPETTEDAGEAKEAEKAGKTEESGGAEEAKRRERKVRGAPLSATVESRKI